MTTPAAVRRSVEVEATPDEVWELVVDDDERAGWFGGETTLEPTPGGAGSFTDPDGTRRSAVVEEVDPGRRISWTWRSDEDPDAGAARVDIDLCPTPSGTRISVTETPSIPTATASALTKPTGRLLDLEYRILCRAESPAITCGR